MPVRRAEELALAGTGIEQLKALGHDREVGEGDRRRLLARDEITAAKSH